MAMDSTSVEATASAVAPTVTAAVEASAIDVAVVEETKTTVVTTTTTTTSSSSVEEEEIISAEHSVSATSAVTTTEVPPPLAIDGVDETETSTVLSSTPPKATTKKWLGGYLPKVPSLLKKPSTASTPATEATAEHTAATAVEEEDDSNEAATGDELRSLTEQPAGDKDKEKEKTAAATTATPTVASRLRGLSIEQNAFARSLVGKIHGFRTQSSMPSSVPSESPRTSIDGMPPLATQRRSLLGGLSGSTTATNGATTNVPSPRSDPNLKARRGACVSTKFGTGTVLDIRLDDGFYIVQLVPKSIAYLREDMIVREIKAVVGERVKTRWGLATVEQYYADEDMYNIALDWRWDDDHVWRMKATTKKFEKISRGMTIVQTTKNKIFTGYSAVRESASYGYANVAAKINTTASTYKATPRSSQTQTTLWPAPSPSPTTTVAQTRGGSLGKALTPYGVVTVVDVRSDQFFVVQTKCGATGYLHADAVKLLHRRTNFALGERVKTPYGHGDVVAYRDEDEVYEVKLEMTVAGGSVPPMLYISDVHAESMMVAANGNGANYARLSSIFTMTRNSVYSASATVKASATGGLTTLSNVKSKVSTMAAIKMTKAKFQKGERVITSFGSGFVTDARPLERIYEVQLRRLKFHGYFHETALQSFPYERVTHFIVDGKTIPAPDMPKNLPEHKRRDIITTAIRQARNGR